MSIFIVSFIILALIMGAIGFAMAASEEYGESNKPFYGMLCFIIGCVFLIWTIVSGCSDYEIVAQQNYPIRSVMEGTVKQQFIDTPRGAIDVQLTFGQLFPDGTIVEETQIDPVVCGINWHPDNTYLYEVIKLPNASP